MGKAQSVDDVRGEPGFLNDYDNLLTERNYPTYLQDTFTIVPCRKVKQEFFNNCAYDKAIKFNNCIDPVLININSLSDNDKEHLCQLACNTKEQKYFDLLAKLIFADTIQKDTFFRRCFVRLLAVYNTGASKKILLKLLNDSDKSVSVISALALYQLGDYNDAIKYFENNYHNKPLDNPETVHEVLMRMNTARSAQVLRKLIKTQTNLFYKLDGLAALSLMGYCTEAFEGFKELTKESYQTYVRIDAVSCLAYYIGTPDVFKIIEIFLHDNDSELRLEAQKVMRNYKTQMKK